MVTKDTTVHSILEVATRWPRFRPLADLIDHMANESDRGVVIVAAGMLDDVLRELLSAFMLQDKASDQLLDSHAQAFATRIELAYSLGLIGGAERQLLNAIRKVRNEFAHTGNVKLSDSHIADRCRSMSHPSVYKSDSRSPRDQYLVHCIIMVTKLSLRSDEVASIRIKPFDENHVFRS